MNIDYYKNLPSSMSPGLLQQEFLKIIGSHPMEVSNQVVHALVELSDRQWNTYQTIDEALNTSLSDLVLKIWDSKDQGRAEQLIGVIARLGLEKAFRKICSIPSNELSSEVCEVIRNSIEEFGDSVADPYSGIR